MTFLSKIGNKLSYLSRIFIYPNSDASIVYNAFFALLMILIISIPDIVLRISGVSSISIHTVVSIVMFILCFFLSFCGTFLKLFIATFIFIIQTVQLNYIYFSGQPLDPFLIPKILVETSDIMENVDFIWKIDPFIVIPFVAIVYFAIKCRKKMYFSLFACIVAFCCFGWLFHKESERSIDEFIVRSTRQTIRNSTSTFAFFLTHIKDITSFDNSLPQKAYASYDVKNVSSDTPRIIVIFFGESTNDRDMSVVNSKCRETTPLLAKFSRDNGDNFLTMSAISGGVATLSSHPLFFNIIREPGNVNCLQTREHNLFKMAKENGYKTHWISTQSIVIPEYSSILADDMHTLERHSIKVKSIHDDYLIKQFSKMDLSKGKHFIVINPRSVHIPYDSNYRHHEKQFDRYIDGVSKRDITLNMYHNNILYLDWLLNELLSIALKKDVDYFLITSDHGEIIGSDGETTHGTGCDMYGHNFLSESVVRVPFLMYSKKKNKKLFQSLKKLGVISHYEISKFVANLIGYDVRNPNEIRDNFFIHDASITGDYKFINYIRQNGEIKKVGSGSVRSHINDIIAKQDAKQEKKSNNETMR